MTLSFSTRDSKMKLSKCNGYKNYSDDNDNDYDDDDE